MPSLSPAAIAALTPAQYQELLNGPSSPPPPGVKANFVNPANWDTVFITTITLCSFFLTCAVAIRCYTKIRLLRNFGREDYTLVIAWAFAMADMALFLITHYQGRGVHQWNLSLRVFEKLLYWVNITTIMYDPCVFFTKLSILLTYLDVFVPTRKGNMAVFVGIWALLLSNFLCYTVDFFFSIFICTPREKIWNPLYQGGHCFDQNKSIEALGIFNAISDFMMLFLPAVSVWKLQMPQRKKAGLYAIFGIGFIGCITSIIRTIYTFKMVNSSDVSWNINAMGAWTSAEITIGLICASLPTFPKFFQSLREEWKQRFSASGRTSVINLAAFSKASQPRNTGQVIDNWEDDAYLRNYYALGDGSESPPGTESKSIAKIAVTTSSPV